MVLRGQMYESFERIHQDSLLMQLSLWVLAGSLLAGLLAGLLLFRLLTHRLRRLTARVDEFRQSGFANYVPYGGRDARRAMKSNSWARISTQWRNACES